MSGVKGMRQHRRLKPLAERFWAKVDVAGPDECWEWTAARNPAGYGKLGRGRGVEGTIDAHRASYELANGPIPPGLVVLHSCDNPPCVNPAHLSVGTYGDNNRDTLAKGRGRWSGMTACQAGHPWSEENTGTTARGTRYCRTCSRRGKRDYKLRLKARAA